MSALQKNNEPEISPTGGFLEETAEMKASRELREKRKNKGKTEKKGKKKVKNNETPVNVPSGVYGGYGQEDMEMMNYWGWRIFFRDFA